MLLPLLLMMSLYENINSSLLVLSIALSIDTLLHFSYIYLYLCLYISTRSIYRKVMKNKTKITQNLIYKSNYLQEKNTFRVK